MTSSEHTSENAAITPDSRAAHEPGVPQVSRFQRFASVSFKQKILLFRALFLVIAFRVGLWLLPFRALQAIAQRKSAKTREADSSGQNVWAVRAVSRYVPGATCLTQALAAQALFSRSGQDSHIEIGVRKDEQSRFHAHAWVVAGDRIVIGGAEADRYIPLAAWKRKSVRAGRI